MTGYAREHLGRFGIWRSATDLTPDLAAGIEQLGFRALWAGGSPGGDLAHVERLLDGTTTLILGTSIVNIWQDDARTVAASFARIGARHPGRFLLGLVVSHQPVVEQLRVVGQHARRIALRIQGHEERNDTHGVRPELVERCR